MDLIAWIRFASVYLNINDPKTFAEMIESAARESARSADGSECAEVADGVDAVRLEASLREAR